MLLARFVLFRARPAGLMVHGTGRFGCQGQCGLWRAVDGPIGAGRNELHMYVLYVLYGTAIWARQHKGSTAKGSCYQDSSYGAHMSLLCSVGTVESGYPPPIRRASRKMPGFEKAVASTEYF